MVFPTTRVPVSNMVLPPEGPQTVPVNLDMTTDIYQEIDITQMVGNGAISFISGVYADNADNPNDLTLVCSGTNQRVIIPANSQGWYPLAITNPPFFTVSQNVAGGLVRLLFVNYPVWPVSNDFSAIGVSDVNLDSVAGSPFADVSFPGVMPVSNIPRQCVQHEITLTGGMTDILVPANSIFSFVCFRSDPGNSAPSLIGMDGLTVNLGGLDINIGGTWVFSGLAISNAITAAGAPGDVLRAFTI